jgi:hypothetical protein
MSADAGVERNWRSLTSRGKAGCWERFGPVVHADKWLSDEIWSSGKATSRSFPRPAAGATNEMPSPVKSLKIAPPTAGIDVESFGELLSGPGRSVRSVLSLSAVLP